MTAPQLSGRGTTDCRGCGCPALSSVLDLGVQPLANELLPDPEHDDPRFPLHLRICRECGLGQVGEFVLPERIFSDYPYLSSMSSSWLDHSREYAQSMRDVLDLQSDDLVVEVASNDGYLLKEFIALGSRVLGVEPAENVAAIAERAGVATLRKFFGRTTAQEVAESHGTPRLIAANNVMAHVPDLDDFVGGFAHLCGDRTIVTVENPSLLNMLLLTQFDTIYHEHFSYLTAHAVRAVARLHDLDLIRVEPLQTHGGSNRYWLARTGREPMHSSVDETIRLELQSGLLDPALWGRFAEASHAAIRGLRVWLDERSTAGDLVAAFGAAAKGNTLMNAADVSTADFVAVTDASPEKQGKFLPGSHIPVIPHDELADLQPDDVLITPWNLADELVAIVAGLLPDARVWAAVPRMRRLA